ncbi:MAG: hypothetical protein Fur005_33980 [Roseiflexaceae bacterium]
MSSACAIKFATDLVTFYSPSYWGGSGDMTDLVGLLAQNGWDAPRFWERILDDCHTAGLDGIEITFAPGDWQSALQAYGSVQGFRRALDDRKLALCSGYLSNRIPGTERYADISEDTR